MGNNSANRKFGFSIAKPADQLTEEDRMLIGISVANCVKELVLRDGGIKDINFISTETNSPSKDDWRILIEENYAGRHWDQIGEKKDWDANKKKAIEIAMQLWDEEKIYQPRPTGDANLARPVGLGPWRDYKGASVKLPDKPVERPAETTLDTSAASSNIPAERKV